MMVVKSMVGIIKKKEKGMIAKKVVSNTGGPVHIICILDRSGSMHKLISDVIGGFNQFVKEQQAIDGDAIISLYIFDDIYEAVYERVDIQEAPELTQGVYFSRGMTSLNDAIGKSLSSHNDGRAIVFINTDGFENSSKEYSSPDVKEMVERKTELGWEFQFVGAGIDAFNDGGKHYGFTVADSVSVSATHAGIAATYTAMSTRASSYRGQPVIPETEDAS
jgi:hypothetical protein